MKINELEISFNIDNIDDYDKFLKAFDAFNSKKAKTPMDNIVSMQKFLKSCMDEETVNKLLEDNRLSTLQKVFSQFFKQASEQLEVALKIIDDANADFEETNERLSALLESRKETNV